MLGKTPVLRIEKFSCIPVDTSWRMRSTARLKTTLPVAPATESSASTNGTPAANVVDKVRANRATADLYISVPTSGSFSSQVSLRSRSAWEVFSAWRVPKMAATSAARMAHHHCCMNSDRLITIRVNAGSSAPKPENTD